MSVKITSIVRCRLLSSACCLFFAWVFQGNASPALPAEASKALGGLASEFIKLKAQHEETRAALPIAYINQLAALKRSFQEKGDLDGMMATVREAKRVTTAIEGAADPFEAVPELPAAALVTSPKELRQLQDAYLKTHAERAAALNRQVADRVSQITERLDELVRELTKRNRIEDALAVRAENKRWSQALANGRAFEESDRLAGTLPAEMREDVAVIAATQRDAASDALPIPTWRSWKLDRIGSYAQEGTLFAHPDLPDELTLNFDSEQGHIRVHGICRVAQAPVEMRERSWFGKAIQWSVPTPAQLEATFIIVSKEVSAGKDFGPAVQIIVQNDKTRQQVYSLPLTYRETTLQLAYDKTTGSHRIVWVQGQSGMVLDLPANAGNIRLLLAVTVYRPGERCDSLIAIR